MPVAFDPYADPYARPIDRTEDLPRGVVTVFMTDVESSSLLWEEHPAQMSQALARQEDVIGQVVRAHNGHLLKARGEGDSTLSVFANASEGIGSCAQPTLRAAPEMRLSSSARASAASSTRLPRDKFMK